MKETLNSYFSQRKAIEFKLFREDLDFLEWFIFWKSTGGMNKNSIIYNEDKYYWISYSKILEDLPLIFGSESTIKRSLNRLIEKRIIKKHLGSKNGARATYFTLDINYEMLLKADSEVKEKKVVEEIKKEEEKNNEIEVITNAWNKLAEEYELSKVRDITKTRVTQLKARLKKHGLNEVLAVMEKIKESNFLLGKIKTWRIDFDFFITESKFQKILEDKYNDKKSKRGNEGIGNRPDYSKGSGWN